MIVYGYCLAVLSLIVLCVHGYVTLSVASSFYPDEETTLYIVVNMFASPRTHKWAEQCYSVKKNEKNDCNEN